MSDDPVMLPSGPVLLELSESLLDLSEPPPPPPMWCWALMWIAMVFGLYLMTM